MNAKNIHFIMKKNYFSRFIWCSVDAGFGSAAGGGCDRRQSTANKITTIEDATAPAPIIIIVDCLCFSCLEISVGGSSDKIVSSILCELADVNATEEKRKQSKYMFSGIHNEQQCVPIYHTVWSNDVAKSFALHHNRRMTSALCIHCIY